MSTLSDTDDANLGSRSDPPASWPIGRPVVVVGVFSTIRRKLFGPQLRWECVDCGTVHKKNPKRCSNCGNTILRQRREE